MPPRSRNVRRLRNGQVRTGSGLQDSRGFFVEGLGGIKKQIFVVFSFSDILQKDVFRHLWCRGLIFGRRRLGFDTFTETIGQVVGLYDQVGDLSVIIIRLIVGDLPLRRFQLLCVKHRLFVIDVYTFMINLGDK